MTKEGNPTAALPMLATRSVSSRKLLMRKAAEKLGETSIVEDALDASFPVMQSYDHPDASESPTPIGCSADSQGSGTTATPELADVSSTLLGSLTSCSDLATPAATLLEPNTCGTSPTWSQEDESAFQTLLMRRKAAGYQRRGRDVSGQVITTGTIKPNAGTVVAVIVGIVAERSGSVGRAELVDAMGHADFPHPKAQPSDKAWCQGYVAGAIRNGFLAVAQCASVTVQAA